MNARGLGKRFAAVAGALAALLAASASAQAGSSFSSVFVDTSAIGSSGSNLAREVKATLEPSLRASFVDAVHPGDRNAPRLVVRITGVTVQSLPEFGGRGGEGGTNTDYMEGEALVVDRGGVIIQRYPMLSALNNQVNAWYLPDYERKRIAALSNHYAYWLKRQLPNQ
ncbi:MAG: hypothetical protein K2P80_06750 [Beijerinckiaceae bacterium]|nr:hypothetical protein [Beijerinckiaceae bacterium]